MSIKLAALTFDTVNIGDDFHTYAVTKMFDVDYFIVRDNYDIIYDAHTGERVAELTEDVCLILSKWFMHSSDGNYGIDNLKWPFTNHPKIHPIYFSMTLAKEAIELFDAESLAAIQAVETFGVRDEGTKTDLRAHNLTNLVRRDSVIHMLKKKDIPIDSAIQTEFQDCVVYVDCRDLYEAHTGPEVAKYVQHYDWDHVHGNTPLERLQDAEKYMNMCLAAKKVYTSREFAFMFCKTMDIPTEYVGPDHDRLPDLKDDYSFSRTALRKELKGLVNHCLANMAHSDSESDSSSSDSESEEQKKRTKK
jgi:hypothetical protein